MTGAINVEYPSISSLAEAYGHLQTIHPNWFVVMGKPTGPGWLCGVDLINPGQAPLCNLLNVLGAQWQTADRRTVAQMRPHFYPVTRQQCTRIFHRRSACYRYYLIPHGGYCASCPLIPEEESIARNRQWMKAASSGEIGKSE
jgi:hypothetical protein